MPKISIVLPVYNGEKYLREAIESILGQTFQDWELLLVNDCSTDTSPEIMREYAAKDSRVRYLENPVNRQLPNSLNEGFRWAEGEYFTWTSDDNCYKKDAIALMAAFLDENPDCGLVYCDMECISGQEGRIKRTSLEPESLCYENCVGACFLYRREAAESTGAYDADMILVEDYDYWLRISRRYLVSHIPQVQYIYRIHDGCLTMTQASKVQEQMYRLRLRELDFLLGRMRPREKEWLFTDMWLYHQEEVVQLQDCFFPQGILPKGLCWLKKRGKSRADNGKKFILFGAGVYGRRALDHFGKERVHCFVDNNKDLVGTEIAGIPVFSAVQLETIHSDYQIVITVNGHFVGTLAEQLERIGIEDYGIFNYRNVIC